MPTRRKAKPRRARNAPPVDESGVNFIERPDGVYWQRRDGGKEYGPYKTLADAQADAEASEVSELEPGESVAEAEAEIGIADWVDPETGDPAEESVPRIEDH